MNWNSPDFLREYVSALRNGSAAAFVGAGMSRAAGFVDWRGLLKKCAEDVGLDVQQEADLVAVAQYYLDHCGTRGPINQLLIEAFPDTTEPTENHALLATLPIKNLWTTNYDRLIEQAFKLAGKRLQAVVTKTHMATTLPDRDAVLYKLHGDIEQPDQAVLTKDDYELYQSRPDAQLFSEALKGDLVEKTFLFIGFSFEDPNIDQILARIRVLMGESKRRHFWVAKMVNPDAGKTPDEKKALEYALTRQRLRIKDLKRYGITAVLIKEYGEVTDLLRALAHLSKLNRVFVSGAMHDPLPLGSDRLQELTVRVGRLLIEHGCVIVSGFGKDIGPHLLYGAMKGAHAKKRDYSRCLDVRPFPHMAPPKERDVLYQKHRDQMISTCGVSVFLSGNKLDEHGKCVLSPGVFKEFETCVRLGVHVVPIGCTGHATKEIWRNVTANPTKYLPSADLGADLMVIGDASKSNDEIIAATGRILNSIVTA
jgi:hypothetical protein